MLIRGAPGGAGSRLARQCAEQWREHGSGLLAFFHGEGVEHAAPGELCAQWRRLAGWHGVELAVCTGSWSRRHRGPPPEPFVLSSLTGFWNHGLEAEQVACFGAALPEGLRADQDRASTEQTNRAPGRGRWVVVIATPPAAPDDREMLELVLAGATLEVDMTVVFAGAGRHHLEPDAIAPWRQLIDFELAELRVRVPDTTLVPIGVAPIEAEAFEALCHDSAGVLQL